MTKDELQAKALDLYWGSIDIHQFMSAVDLYSKALLQQTIVSRSAAKPDVEVLSIAEDGSIVFRYNPIV